MSGASKLSFLNTSVAHLSTEELQKEVDSLKMKVVATQDERESRMQEVHNLNREVARFSALESDYKQEIALLKKGNPTECKTQEELLQEEEWKANTEEAQKLELDIASVNSEIKKLREERESKKAVKLDNAAEHNRLTNENAMLKNDLKGIGLVKESVQMHLNVAREYNDDLNAKLKNKLSEFNELEENYNVKKTEHQEVIAEVEVLQDELMRLRCELDVLKSKPLDNSSRGNSLFAEVEDRCVKLQSNIKMAKYRYTEMKQKRSELLLQIVTHQNENYQLSKRWEEDIVQKKADNESLQESLQDCKRKIKILMEPLESYKMKAEIGPVFNSKETSRAEQCMELMMNRKRQELKELLVNMEQLSKIHTDSFETIEQVTEEAQEWKSKSRRLEHEVAQMRTEIKMLKLKSAKECDITYATDGKFVKNKNIVTAVMPLEEDKIAIKTKDVTYGMSQTADASDVKSNFNENKSTTADENCGGNKSKPKRRGMIVKCPLVYIGSSASERKVLDAANP